MSVQLYLSIDIDLSEYECMPHYHELTGISQTRHQQPLTLAIQMKSVQ